MFRFTLLVALCLSSVGVYADDPPASLIVVSTRQTAMSLPPVPREASIAVLIQDRDDSYATINARALAMRHATHFVSDRDDDSLLTQLFRERLIGLGAIPIEVRKSRSQALGLAGSNRENPNNHPSFTNLFAGQ